MKTLLSILFAVLLAGCMSVQKATNYLDKKGELPKLCATRYPVQDSKIIIKERVNTDTVLGTSYIYLDTCNGKVVQKPCPPSKTITNTIVRDTTIYQRDRAHEALLQLRLDAKQDLINKLLQDKQSLDSANKLLRKDLIQSKKEANDWQWKAVFTWIVIGAGILFIIFKKFK